MENISSAAEAESLHQHWDFVNLILIVLGAMSFYALGRKRARRQHVSVKAHERKNLGCSFLQGRRVDLSPAENAMISNSVRFPGQMRILSNVELVGPAITKGFVQSKLAILQKRHPVLQCTVEKHSGGHANSYQLVQDGSAKVNIKEIWTTHDGTDKPWQEIWKVEGRNALKVGEMVLRVVIIRYTNEPKRTNLLIMVEHGFSDGLCVSQFVHELLLLMSGDSKLIDAYSFDPLPWNAPLEEMCTTGNRNWLFQILSWMAQSTCSVVSDVIPHKVSPKVVPKDVVKGPELLQTYKDFTPEESARLLQACRENGTSVTAAVAIAMLDAMADVSNTLENTISPRNFVTQIAADLRRHYSQPIDKEHLFYHAACTAPMKLYTMGNLSSSEMWEEARVGRKHVIESSKRGDAKGAAQLLGSILGFEEYIPPCTATLTSWGKLPIQATYGPWTLGAHRPCVNTCNSKLVMVICTTVQNKTNLAFVANSNVSNDKVLELVKMRTYEKLLTMMKK